MGDRSLPRLSSTGASRAHRSHLADCRLRPADRHFLETLRYALNGGTIRYGTRVLYGLQGVARQRSPADHALLQSEEILPDIVGRDRTVAAGNCFQKNFSLGR